MEDTDLQLQLKKRARRRLVGALAFVSVVAVLLPMVMDHEPRQVVQEVEIRIPGQDEKPFAPKFAVAPVEKAAARQLDVAPAPEVPLPPPKAEPLKEKVPEALAQKAPEKLPEVPPLKEDKPVAAKNDADAKRAAAILAGQLAPPPAAPATSKSGEYLVLIGAFSNEANVKNIKSKLAELNIKAFSEPLDTPQGKKTRVRAGPFPNREAAEKALEKMQRIGVPGVVSAK